MCFYFQNNVETVDDELPLLTLACLMLATLLCLQI